MGEVTDFDDDDDDDDEWTSDYIHLVSWFLVQRRMYLMPENPQDSWWGFIPKVPKRVWAAEIREGASNWWFCYWVSPLIIGDITWYNLLTKWDEPPSKDPNEIQTVTVSSHRWVHEALSAQSYNALTRLLGFLQGRKVNLPCITQTQLTGWWF